MWDALGQFLTAPWQYTFLVRALIVAILAGILCPVLGVYVVTRQFGFMGDALAHSVLPGMVLALWLGASPLLGAIAAAVGMALAIGFLVQRTGLGTDTSIGILFAGSFALGLLLLSLLSTPSLKLDALLMGQVLAVTGTDVAMAAGITLLVLLALLALHRDLVFVTFDPLGAAVVGLPTRVLDHALLILLALVIVLALQAVGIVLVISLLITPAAAALMWARAPLGAMGLGALLGTIAAVLGLYTAFHYNLAPGPVIALISTGFFVITAILRPRPQRA